jgi:myosin heavy subunit
MQFTNNLLVLIPLLYFPLLISFDMSLNFDFVVVDYFLFKMQSQRTDFERATATTQELATKADEMDLKRRNLIKAAEESKQKKMSSLAKLEKQKELIETSDRQIIAFNKKIATLESDYVNLQSQLEERGKQIESERRLSAQRRKEEEEEEQQRGEREARDLKEELARMAKQRQRLAEEEREVLAAMKKAEEIESSIRAARTKALAAKDSKSTSTVTATAAAVANMAKLSPVIEAALSADGVPQGKNYAPYKQKQQQLAKQPPLAQQPPQQQQQHIQGQQQQQVVKKLSTDLPPQTAAAPLSSSSDNSNIVESTTLRENENIISQSTTQTATKQSSIAAAKYPSRSTSSPSMVASISSPLSDLEIDSTTTVVSMDSESSMIQQSSAVISTPLRLPDTSATRIESIRHHNSSTSTVDVADSIYAATATAKDPTIFPVGNSNNDEDDDWEAEFDLEDWI